MRPTIGRIVHYRLTEHDVRVVEQIRATTAFCNPHHCGQVLPMIVCVVFPHEFGEDKDGVNGQVLLDGNRSLWVLSAREGGFIGQWSWPTRDGEMNTFKPPRVQ